MSQQCISFYGWPYSHTESFIFSYLGVLSYRWDLNWIYLERVSDWHSCFMASTEEHPAESTSPSANDNRYLVSEEIFPEGAAEWINEDDDDDEHNDMPLEENLQGGKLDGFSGDPSTLSRPDFWRVTNIGFELTADFAKKILHGFVDLEIEKQSSDEQNLVRNFQV